MSQRVSYKAIVEREGNWWLITIPALDAVTQARRLDQVEHLARDLIAAWLDADIDEIAVTLDVRIPEEWLRQVAAVRQLQQQAAQTRQDATRRARQVARQLHAQGLPFRDVGAVLGVTYQRAAQLTKPNPPPTAE